MEQTKAKSIVLSSGQRATRTPCSVITFAVPFAQFTVSFAEIEAANFTSQVNRSFLFTTYKFRTRCFSNRHSTLPPEKLISASLFPHSFWSLAPNLIAFATLAVK
ncbi:MAG: hypothetical protein AAFN77_08400 [Planctomycetota bacterium]